MVGFNRRFSPFSSWLKSRLDNNQNLLTVHCTINAGSIEQDHWTYDKEQGGGRIVGEVCHFIDLIQYFTNSYPIQVHAESSSTGSDNTNSDVVISVKMSTGSLGSITYVSTGDKSFPRERIEIFGNGSVGIIDNFKSATFTHGGRKQRIRNWFSSDRGHRNEM